MRRRVSLFAMAVVTALASGAAPHHEASPLVSRTDSLRDVVLARAAQFIAQWDTVWKASERERHGFSIGVDAEIGAGPRHRSLHCHPDDIRPRGPLAEHRMMRVDGTSWFAVCPSFELGDIRTNIEERWNIDASLLPARRDTVRLRRAALNALLDTAARHAPADDMIAGQRVRFLVDQRELDTALAAARACGGTAWWCKALSGYVHAARGEMAAAESLYVAASRSMPADEHCEWNNLERLIDPDGRDKYPSSCEKRDAINERIWWLADPLLIEDGNGRRVDQFVRMTLLRLRTALPRGERYSWSIPAGNGARIAMIERYGWPSYMYYGGANEDRTHTGYLAGHLTAPNEPYTTYEYLGSRVHLIPSWSAIANPAHADARDWTLTEMAARDVDPLAKPAPVVKGPGGKPLGPPFWWPVEHYGPTLPLIQLPAGMHALLRRYDSALLAASTELPAPVVERDKGEMIDSISLVASSGPGRTNVAARTRAAVGQSVAMSGAIPADASIAGVEYLASGKTKPAGRTRFGVVIPPFLKELRTNEIAVSDPILLRPPAGGTEIPAATDDALSRMATSNVVPAKGRFGIYWETYAIKPADSVEVAVWIERATGQSIARRFGIALGVATDLNTPIAVSWREPDPGHRAYVVTDNVVPIIARTLVIDIASLAPGTYRLEVAARRMGDQEPARGQTLFVVR